MKMETDDEQTFQQQALEIREPAPDFDPTIAPQNGDEYLMHMLYERKRCPAVVVKRPALIQSATTILSVEALKIDETMSAKSTCASLLPTVEWKSAQRDDFLATCEKIKELRFQLAAHNYDNKLEPPLVTDTIEWKHFCSENPPLLRTVLRLGQRTLERLLEMISEWLSEGEEIATEGIETTELRPVMICASSSSSAAAAAPTDAGVTLDLSNSEKWIGVWLYATMASLHWPVEPDVHSTLRDIARTCIRLRNRLQSQELEKAVPYNLFIHLISSVFAQYDFAEFV